MPTAVAQPLPLQSQLEPHTGPIHVLLVDDHPAVRVGARKLIDEQPDMTVVAEAASVAQALAEPPTGIDVAVVDYQLGGGADGLALTIHLKQLALPPPVLIYSAFADNALAAAAVIAGADGLLGKQALGEELCLAIRRLARGKRYLPAVTPALARAVAAGLGPDDQALVGMLLHGVDRADVADQLGVTLPQLDGRCAGILRALKRRPSADLRRAPLDYERGGRPARMAHRIG